MWPDLGMAAAWENTKEILREYAETSAELEGMGVIWHHHTHDPKVRVSLSDCLEQTCRRVMRELRRDRVIFERNARATFALLMRPREPMPGEHGEEKVS